MNTRAVFQRVTAKGAGKQTTMGEILRPRDAADYLSISESKLAKLRMRQNQADGPRFSRIGGCVIYRKSDLDEWIESNLS